MSPIKIFFASLYVQEFGHYLLIAVAADMTTMHDE